MKTRIIARMGRIAMTLGGVLALGACGTMVRPDDLKRPEAISCIDVPAGIESHTTQGLLRYNWTTKLAPGAYVSEGEDADGTYYRGPYEAITADADSFPKPSRMYDGGIWVPRKGDQAPAVYTYFAWKDPKTTPPSGVSCANAIAVRGQGTSGVREVRYVTRENSGQPAVGGASTAEANAGFEAGLQMGTSGTFTGGQVSGAGVAGGAIGGIVVAALIQMDVGKISVAPYLSDEKLSVTLKQLAQSARPIKIEPAAPAAE